MVNTYGRTATLAMLNMCHQRGVHAVNRHRLLKYVVIVTTVIPEYSNNSSTVPGIPPPVATLYHPTVHCTSDVTEVSQS